MVKKFWSQGKALFFSPQPSVLSAATVIMIMIVASRVLGLVRQIVLAHFFAPGELALFFAAFRLPDLIFEVLVFGTFSSAFIPVFVKALKESDRKAWDIAGRVVNIGLVFFVFVAGIFAFFAHQLYRVIAPGFDTSQTATIADLARILFVAQGFFVVSYVLTGVLESLRRFLVPALAPIFYNLGIILGTILLTRQFGLWAPAIGVVLGAICHFLIQLPLATQLGFRFSRKIGVTPEVREIGRLAAPRLVDLSFQQVAKTVELSLSSVISTASYTYFTFANTLQLLPVSLFGISLAKAALPTLAHQVDSRPEFKKTLLTTLSQIVFLVTPLATLLIVLKIPIVRLVYGTGIFDWQATTQTGLVLTAFAAGILFQAAIPLLARAFYALHDTKTPVLISLVSVGINILANFILIRVFFLPVWALAAAFSLGVFIQAVTLFYFLLKRLGDGELLAKLFVSMGKSFSAALASGLVMYFLLKFFDRWVWVKKGVRGIPFERFVLDTRYTGNLLVLTVLVALAGAIIYVALSWLFKSAELATFISTLKRFRFGLPPKEREPVTGLDSS